MPAAFHTRPHLTLTMLSREHYHCHFVNEETEDLRDWAKMTAAWHWLRAKELALNQGSIPDSNTFWWDELLLLSVPQLSSLLMGTVAHTPHNIAVKVQ